MWEKLHSEELYGLYYSHNVIAITKWRRILLVGDRMGIVDENTDLMHLNESKLQ